VDDGMTAARAAPPFYKGVRIVSIYEGDLFSKPYYKYSLTP